jgi:hypothetical protein
MATDPSADMIREARHIVAGARARGVTLRLLGGRRARAA